MTKHFVNILTWKFFLDNISIKNEINIDGFLLVLLLKLFNCSVKKKSGLIYYHDLDKNSFGYILNSKTDLKDSIVCPFWESIEDINPTYEILNFTHKYDKIIIGISSPKQDKLALLLNNKFPKKEFICLGAAVYSKPIFNSENLFNTWISLFISNPFRTLSKLYKSLLEVKKIILNKKERNLFRQFINTNFSKNN